MQCSARKKSRRKAPTGNGPHQPANVVTRSAAQGMQRIAQRPFHPTADHAVVGLGVADGRFNLNPARVLDDALELGGFDGFDVYGAFDGGLEQLLQALFSQQAAKAADLRGVARQRSTPCR